MKITKIEKIKNESNAFNDNVLQYYSNYQILELLKEKLTEIDYAKFIKNSVNDTTQSVLEMHLIENISKTKLLELIKNYDIDIYNTIVNLMTELLIK